MLRCRLLVSTILINLAHRETKQRTLEELDQIFSVPVGVFARYQLTQTLPFWIKRYVLFQKSARLAPLYKLGELEGVEKEDHVAELRKD